MDEVRSSLDASKKTVFISGASGQDGSIMAEFLLNTDKYNVVGGIRSYGDSVETPPLCYLTKFDLADPTVIEKVIRVLHPEYFINFAAQTSVKLSWDFPAQTWETNTTGIIHILETIRKHNPSCKFLNCGSSEEFGTIVYNPQDEKHPMNPTSPYGSSKVAARQLIKIYREAYNLFAIQPWLFNHESPRRKKMFVTRKITSKAVEITKNIMMGHPVSPLELGNIHAMRDWTDAEDTIRAIWAMINKTVPTEYVVSTGQSHSLKEFIEIAFGRVGISGEWYGSGEEEYFWYTSGPRPLPSNECQLVKINPILYRPAEVDSLCGDNRKIYSELKWKPQTAFRDLVLKMVEYDANLAGI